MKKKLITSALPYVNNSPHLGNIIGCVLSADVYARFCRSRGYQTLFICGTDEYGTATETKARQENKTPKEICDEFYPIHVKVYRHFNISFDAFGRSSDPEHSEIVQKLFKDAEKTNAFFPQTIEQAYCNNCQSFLADRFVSGTCPHCQSEEARGDQCDNCAQLLSTSDLQNPHCTVCQTPPEFKPTEHLYFDLQKYKNQLQELHKKVMHTGKWTQNAISSTQAWLENLKARPITRDLTWGVPVPHEKFKDKVFYVWFDAPIGYISITKKAFPDTWQDWWQDPENTQLHHFLAKDNIPFHSVMFPTALLASGGPWTLVHNINSTEYLNYEGAKFSKSQGRGVFGSDVIGLDIPIDLWRFYLLRIRPERQDSSFSWQDFGERVNNEFINNICNFFNRVLAFINRRFEGKVQLQLPLTNQHKNFYEEYQKYQKDITQALESGQLRNGLNHIITMAKAANRFFQEEEPWKTVKDNPETAEQTLALLSYLIKDFSIVLNPYLPSTANKIAKLLGLENPPTWEHLGETSGLQTPFPKPEILYQKLEPELINNLAEKFA